MRGEKDLYILLDPVGPAPYIDLFRPPIVLHSDLRRFLRIVRFCFNRKSIDRSLICLHDGGFVYVCVVDFARVLRWFLRIARLFV